VPPDVELSFRERSIGLIGAGGEQQMGSVVGYHHVALSVHDLERSARWYESLFDLDLQFDEAGDGRTAKVYRLRGTATMLGLVAHGANDGSPFTPTRTGLDHVAFEVESRAEVDGWADQLSAAGIEHSGAIDIPVGAILNFADPDGTQLSIFWEER
jgi:glyoxylase I family protein